VCEKAIPPKVAFLQSRTTDGFGVLSGRLLARILPATKYWNKGLGLDDLNQDGNLSEQQGWDAR